MKLPVRAPRSGSLTMLLCLFVCASSFPSTALAQPPSRIVADGTVLILELDTRLDSKITKASDRFSARVIESVTDEAGRTLIPVESTVSGFVKSVTPAKYRHRSGIIEVFFDKLTLPNGRSYGMTGMLTSADSSERRRIDEEGVVTPGSDKMRHVVFVGGGAGSGAIIGVLTGSAILGAGVGAAVGLAASFLYKGQEAVVEQGARIGVEMTQGLDLTSGKLFKREQAEPDNQPPTQPAPVPQPPPTQPPTNNTGYPPAPPPNSPPVTTPPATNPPPVNPPDPNSLVRVSNFQLVRGTDGSVGMILTAETNTGGWRLSTRYATDRDLLEIWLQGERPKGMAAQVISYPAITVTVPDAARVLRRVIIHGSNGDFAAEIPMK